LVRWADVFAIADIRCGVLEARIRIHRIFCG
jgi:hypothetical protein